MTQYRSPLLPDGSAWGNSNCGPTSTVIALRLLGLDLPGFAGERSQAVVDAARLLATGGDDPDRATTKAEQHRVLEAGGARVVRTRSLDAALACVREGAVMVAGGDRGAPGWPAGAGDAPERTPTGLEVVRAGLVVPPHERTPRPHAVVIAGYAPDTGRYVVCDPSIEQPVEVTAQQLQSFTEVGRVVPGHMRREGLIAWRAGDVQEQLLA